MKPIRRRVWIPPGANCNSHGRKATTPVKTLDPDIPEVRGLVGMLNELLPDGWAVREHEIIMDIEELRVVCGGPNGVEKWFVLSARELFRAKNPDTFLRFAMERWVKESFPKSEPNPE